MEWENVTISTDPPGAVMIWNNTVVGVTGQPVSLKRASFQDPPGVDQRVGMQLQKSGYYNQTVWMDADLWRYHRWPPSGSLRLQPATPRARLEDFIRHEGPGLFLGLTLAFLGLVAGALLRYRLYRDGERRWGRPVWQALVKGGVRDRWTVVFVHGADFEGLSSLAPRYGGDVVRNVGEECLVLFGERDAESAVEFARALRSPGVTASLHCAPAVTAILGAEQRQWTLVGREVNLAARLLGLARELGRDVVISQAVLEQVGKDAASPLGSFALKGQPDPVPVFHLSPTEASADPSHR